MHADARVRPRLTDFFSNARQCPDGQWFVGLVVEERDASALIVIANQSDERRDGAITLSRPADFIHQRLWVQSGRSDGNERHRLSMAVPSSVFQVPGSCAEF